MIYSSTRNILPPESTRNFFFELDPEVQDKNIEYTNYIAEHINNVSLIFSRKRSMILEFLEEYIYLDIGNVNSNTGSNFKGSASISDMLAKRIAAHDASKMSNGEFHYYRAKYYPTKMETATLEKYADAKERLETCYNMAWIHHAHNNDHHPEYWITRDHDGKEWKDIFVPMPIIPTIEMLIDWEAMSIKFGGTAAKYYRENKDKKPFHRETIDMIEQLIYIFE